MKCLAGTEATFQASFFLPNNSPATLDSAPTVSFADENGSEALLGASAAVSHVSGADWEAVVTIPAETEVGWYKIVWESAISGTPIFGFQTFEVSEDGYAVIRDKEAELRRRLRDQLANPPDDSGAFFLNDEIHSLLAINADDVYGAALDGWLLRAAHYQNFVDVAESGSERKMSQTFRQAKDMADFYKRVVDGKQGKRDSAISGRVVGVVASLRGEYVDTFGLLATRGLASPDAGYVRIFPMHRFMWTAQAGILS